MAPRLSRFCSDNLRVGLNASQRRRKRDEHVTSGNPTRAADRLVLDFRGTGGSGVALLRCKASNSRRSQEFVRGRSWSGFPRSEIHDVAFRAEIGAEFLICAALRVQPSSLCRSIHRGGCRTLSLPPPTPHHRTLKWAGDPRSMPLWELSNTWRVLPPGGGGGMSPSLRDTSR